MAKKIKSSGADADLLRIAAFILFDALLFHLVLANSHVGVDPFSKKGKLSWQKFLASQWKHIRAHINYEPVFSLALDVLESLPTAPDTEDILTLLADSAESAVHSGILLKHDFVGRIYHKLLLSTTGHYYATYYTSIPAAWLLANLAVKTPHPSWYFGDLSDIANLSVIDPACGSGTLLSAAYTAIRDAYILNVPKVIDLDKLHQTLLSKVIHGWDVLDFAAHLSLTTLALHSNSVSTNSSNIYTVPIGVTKTHVHLGSLDHLVQAETLTGLGLVQSPEKKGMDLTRETKIERRKYDLVLMNPPFSRSAKPNLTFGFSENVARKRMQTKLSELAQTLGLSGIGRAGLGTYFMILGLELVAEGGRIGIVIPRSMLSGVSWKKVRARYLQECEIKYIVSNFDPGGPDIDVDPWSWSENTDLGEVLIVAEKTKKAAQERVTTYVNIYHKPRNEIEALLVSQDVIKKSNALEKKINGGNYDNLTVRKSSSGVLYKVQQSALTHNWLAPCIFAQPELDEFVLGIIGDAKLKPFSKLCSIVKGHYAIGPDIAQVKKAFEPSVNVTSYPLILGHQGDMVTIDLTDEKLTYGKPKATNAASLHLRHSATLLVAERPHLSTEALLGMRAPLKVLTTAFWEIHLKKSSWDTMMLAWINSTYGVVSFLACATSSMGDIIKMKKDQLGEMPVPDPKDVDLIACVSLLNTMNKCKFLPYSAEFSRAADGSGPRYKLDQFFYQQLGLTPLTKALYQQLARDPVVCRNRLP